MKKLVSVLLALTMLLCAFSGTFGACAATLTYAEQKLETIQKTTGFIPGKTAVVTGNCYGFISKVCEKLYGKAYQEQLDSYTCKHATGLYYEVSRLTTTSDKSANSTNIKNLVSFLKNNAMPGDIIHYASLSNSSSKHTFMVQSIDDEKIRIFHSNYGSDNCQIDTIYWSSFISNPTTNCTVSGVNSRNTILTAKMGAKGLGISVNRFTNYNSLFYSVGVAADIAPTASAKSVSSTTITVSWNAVSGATKYQVDYRLVGTSSFTKASDTETKTSYDVKYLTVGSTYEFRVRAYAGKWMSYSKTVTCQALPAQINGASLKLVSNGISITWSKYSDINGVRIYRSTKKDSGYSQIKSIASNTTISYTDTSVKYNQTYYYKLLAYKTVNGNEYSSYSNPYQVTYALKTPAMLYDRLSAASVKITVGTDGCQDSLVYYVSSDGKITLRETETTDETVTLEGLTLGKQYTVFCKEKTALGESEWGKLTFTALPKSVDGVKVSGVNSCVRISYQVQSDADGYYIFKALSADGEFKKIGEVINPETAYFDDADIKLNVAYFYKVQSFKKKDGKVYAGDLFDDSIKAVYRVGTPLGITTETINPYSFTVHWKASNHASTYILQYKQNGGKWVTVKNIKGTSYRIRRLTPGKKYVFRVCGVDAKLGSGSYSSEKKLKLLPPTPTIKSVKKVSKGIKITYTPVEYSTGYAVFRSTSKNGTYKKIAVIPSAKTTSYVDKNVKKNKTYYYKVWCYHVVGKKVYRSDKSEAVKLKYK